MTGPSPIAQAALERLQARIGPRWAQDIRAHSQQVKDAYAPLLRAAPPSGAAIARDQPYGAHPRQVLDLFRPADLAAEAGAPVAVFVHGGGFVRGDKCVSGELYDNVMHWFVRQGWVAANVEYRLAPEAPFPAGAEDVALAMDWLHRQVAAYGGDPARLLLIGHSAGGTHVASYAFDPALGYLGRHAAALALLSARLRADALPANPNAAGVRAYFGEDMARYEQRSPVRHAATGALPVFIAIAEFENPLLDVYGLEFAHALAAARGRAPRVLQLRGHNHMSMVAHFNSGEERLGRELLDFFHRRGADE
ncbi:alpha/beta hydrolase [Variovorax terrae]|uniref:Alpha/beta hydrolase n=1 Tax=Variovorax terrae TaxID=2923278 RepID=A0A9X1VY91_9BURK|nr:alpha/beta hydrolase [Variovorax terrae]MCJ0765150.1 alpha/beta hydrolase [Variovorax terrae]